MMYNDFMDFWWIEIACGISMWWLYEYLILWCVFYDVNVD